MLVIDPEECIDCTLCVEECPAHAIFSDDEVPDDQRDFLGINAELAPQWPVLAEKIDAPADADAWNGRPGKRLLLEYGEADPAPLSNTPQDNSESA